MRLGICLLKLNKYENGLDQIGPYVLNEMRARTLWTKLARMFFNENAGPHRPVEEGFYMFDVCDGWSSLTRNNYRCTTELNAPIASTNLRFAFGAFK